MAQLISSTEHGDTPSWRRWLDRPQSNLICASSWIVASSIFIGLIALFGGPSQGDSAESLYTIWAISHGSFSCAYPPASTHLSSFFLFYQPSPAVPPLWPLISAGGAAITRIGHNTPFPSQPELGPHCTNAYLAMFHWAQNTGAIFPTIGLGYLSWFVLLAGVVVLVRASGRGRSGWEVAAVILVSAVPIVWEPLLLYYHPQDLVALGLALIGTACALRRQWVWAGVSLGLAVSSQQFALLVLVPLFVIAPGRARWKLLTSSAAVVAALSLPFIVASSGRAVHSVLLGTGDSTTHGGTLVWESGLRGTALVFVARVLPLLVAVTIAWWAHRRLGSSILKPIPLISLLATTLSMRVVFEEGLFGYKLMALAVMIVLVMVVQGRFSGWLIAWLAMASLAFNPIPSPLSINGRNWGGKIEAALPLACIVVVLILIAYDAYHRRVRLYLLAWLAVALAAFGQWPPWTLGSVRQQLPLWLLQLILLPTGVALAVTPLIRSIQTARAMPTLEPESARTGAQDDGMTG